MEWNVNISGGCLWMSCCPGLFLHLADKKWEEREVLLPPCALLSVHREKRQEHTLLFVLWEAGAGFSSVASLVSRPRFIKRITWHSWENVYGCCCFCRVWAVPAQETGGSTVPDLFWDVWSAAMAAVSCSVWPGHCSAPGSVCSIPNILAALVWCFFFSVL